MGLSTSLDLEPPDILRNPEHLPSVLALVDTLFLNREAFDRAGDALGAPLAPSHLHPGGEILVTLGAAGCRRLTQSGMDEMPGFKVSARDTTGAGDCFAGAYLVAKLMDATPLDAMRSANAAAALATLSVGAQTAMPDRASVDAFLRANLAPLPDTLSLTGDLNA
jgi:ribokinase